MTAVTSPAYQAARIMLLEEAVVGAWQIITDTVPTTPTGLHDWYMENLTEIVEDIRRRRSAVTP